ncbi:MAG: extracellular solute-binding protein, partial [Firmicutes bacterium]|nr:extracellular solute-binding protein [Bacillota bacterium]
MKKLLAFLLAFIIMGTAALTGCLLVRDDGKVDDTWLDEIDLTADEEFPGELRIRTWNIEYEVNTMNALIAAFNKKYPHIRVTYTQDHVSTYYSTLTNDFGVAAQTNDYSKTPDVFWIAPDNLASFHKLGNIIAPISKIEEKDASFSSDIFVEEAIGTCAIDDTVYIMPRDFSQVVMYFNQDIFDAAGVAYPAPQMSGAAFMSMLAALRAGLNASTAVNGYGVPYKDAVRYLVDVNPAWDAWLWPLAKSFGGEVVNAQGEAALDSEATYNAVAFWKQMRDNDYAYAPFGPSVGVNFRMQQSALYIHTRSVLSEIISSTNQIRGVKNLGVTSIPQFGPSYSVASGCSGYSMYAKAERKTEAWLFLKFVASEEGQNAFCASGNGVPAVKSMLMKEDSAWRKYTSDAFGSAFDNDAFVYGMDMNPRPYTSAYSSFLQKVPVAQHQNVLQCLTTCFLAVDSDN